MSVRVLWKRHLWFVRNSKHYLGGDYYTWQRRLEFPRAWLKFMWASRHDPEPR